MNSVTINEEDETEASSDNKNGGSQPENVAAVAADKEDKPETEAPPKEHIPDIEDTVGDVEMKNRKMEALDKIK